MAHVPVSSANPRTFAVALIAALAAAVALFVYFGLANVPAGRSPQEAASYFGARLIPFGLCLMLIGFAQTLAIAVANALPSGPASPIGARATVGLSTLAELLRAVTGLSATPAGIGALVALLGTFLLVGSGAAAGTVP